MFLIFLQHTDINIHKMWSDHQSWSQSLSPRSHFKKVALTKARIKPGSWSVSRDWAGPPYNDIASGLQKKKKSGDSVLL